MDELKIILDKYRKIIVDMIQLVTNEEYDSIQTLVDERQALIEQMKLMEINKEELRAVYNDLKLGELQGELDSLMDKSMNEIKLKIKKLQTSKKANRDYNKSGYVDSLFVYKKI